MTIGVDAGSLCISDNRLKVGVWRVTQNLLTELSRIDQENTYRLYSFQPIDREVMNGFGPRFENKVVTPTAGWSSFWLPLELRRRPVDVYLGLSQSIPDSKSYNVGFIYDLGFFYESSAYGKSYFQLKNQTDNLVSHARHIVTISESSKSDIINHYKILPEQISVSYPGVGEVFTPLGKHYKGDHPYFLFVGSLNKAKDLPLAIESFTLFLNKVKKPYDFLLIGGDYWSDPRIDESIHRYHLEDRVKRLGFIEDENLPTYYRGATAFFTTALHEGFCLPAAESMSSSTPVVSVDRGAFKEVIGEAGLISSSLNPEVIADSLFQIATNSPLRKKLSENAKNRAKIFSWKRFAKDIYELINKTN